MASKAMPGLIKYTASCKECEWTFDTDSTQKLQETTRAHRKEHWRNSPEGKAEAKRLAWYRQRKENERMANFYYSKRQEYARDLEKSKQELDAAVSFLAAADKMVSRRDGVIVEIAELRERVEKNRRMFDACDRKWAEVTSLQYFG